MRVGASVLLSLFAVACGTEDARTADTTAAANWQLLTSLDWQLDPGREYSTCVRTSLERDLSITRFEPISPRGTHHSVLGVGGRSAPDGQSGCDVLEPRTLLFGAGVGTNALILPPGVVMHIRAGQQLILGLHLFNTTATTLSGTSGARAQVVEASPAHVNAEAISVGTRDLRLPPGRSTVTKARCTLTRESTVFALHPHMHALGTHLKVVVRSGGSERVIHDKPFDFAEQPIHPIEPLRLFPGDQVEIECTHRNTGTSLVAHGESSSAEMCAVGVYRYPASSDGAYFCSD
jgi:hypothetical protein